MVAIGGDRLFTSSTIYKHGCFDKVNKLYTKAGIFDGEKRFKVITEETMVSTTKELTYNSPMKVADSGTKKKPIEWKQLHQFYELFDNKRKITARGLDAAKIKCNTIKREPQHGQLFGTEKVVPKWNGTKKALYLSDARQISLNKIACGLLAGYTSETPEHVESGTNFEQSPSQNI